MVHLHKIAGKIIEGLEAFEGSRQAIDSNQILIVRAMSKKELAIEDMENELSKIVKKLEAKEINPLSDDATKLINRMDEQVRANVQVTGDSYVTGLENMKASLESMGLHVEYKMMKLQTAGAIIITWKDKSGMGPLYVEVVISDDEGEGDN
ncbi:MAG: DUF2120 family protein [Methanobacteriaceae archaeon]